MQDRRHLAHRIDRQERRLADLTSPHVQHMPILDARSCSNKISVPVERVLGEWNRVTGFGSIFGISWFFRW